MHVTTINEKEAMNLKENKKRVYGRIWREERKGKRRHNYAMNSKIKETTKSIIVCIPEEIEHPG